MEHSFQVTANWVDLIGGDVSPATVTVEGGFIRSLTPAPSASGYMLPGFVDAHVHIESSMLLPSEFARAAVVHGTVATVSDPHEIANVCGIDGVELMLRDSARTPLKFYFGAPSCVPATEFETSGARLDAKLIEQLLDDPRINHLSEVMNYPGVISRDPQVMAKVAAARARGLPVDGHAPGVRGDEARRYFGAGISTDHECVSLAEAVDKIRYGCKVMIREGSAARNFDALRTLIDSHTMDCMFCSDDKHPDDLLVGHIDRLVARAVQNGSNVSDVLRVACHNPVQHYRLGVGLLRPGDPADFIVVQNLEDFAVRATYINGLKVAEDGVALFETQAAETMNNFGAARIGSDDLRVATNSDRMRVIRVLDGQLITREESWPMPRQEPETKSDVKRDVLKLVVVNRYRPEKPAIGFVHGFGLNRGALASSVAHDSHNLIAVGVDDEDLVQAMNTIIQCRGGLAVAAEGSSVVLPLPVAGLMSTRSCAAVAKDYQKLDRRAKQLGCALRSPFMTLSFLSLPVIPELKLLDGGLFDVRRLQFVSLFPAESTGVKGQNN